MSLANFNIALTGLGLSFFIFTGCNQSKTSSSVMSQQTFAGCEQNTLSQRYIVQWEDGRISLEKGLDDASFRKNFVDKKLALIRHVDRDYRIRLDTQSVTQKLQATAREAVPNWGPNKIRAEDIWAEGFHGENVKVGIIDGMVDETNAQLSNNIALIKKFNNEINDPHLNRHGTHVAGIIAADPGNGLPVQGVAPKAKILGGQFISNDGSGSIGDAIVAMQAIAAEGARILNMSWGGAPCVSNLKNAFTQLSDQGVLLVTASGNESLNLDYTSSYPSTIGARNQVNVAATDSNDLMPFFSNRGYKTVQVAAPGVGIISTIPLNKTESMDGTSMAAPMVSGVAALLMSAEPSATAQQVKSAILRSVDIGAFDLQVNSRGRINAKKALQELRLILSTN